MIALCSHQGGVLNFCVRGIPLRKSNSKPHTHTMMSFVEGYFLFNSFACSSSYYYYCSTTRNATLFFTILDLVFQHHKNDIFLFNLLSNSIYDKIKHGEDDDYLMIVKPPYYTNQIVLNKGNASCCKRNKSRVTGVRDVQLEVSSGRFNRTYSCN